MLIEEKELNLKKWLARIVKLLSVVPPSTLAQNLRYTKLVTFFWLPDPSVGYSTTQCLGILCPSMNEKE